MATFLTASRDAREDGFLDINGAFSSISVPGSSSTSANGINDAGEIVGAANGQGVVDQGGALTEFSVPGSTNTSATGINNEGEIVGDYSGQLQAAPEPGTMVLLATGLLVLAGLRYRRRIAPTPST